MKLQLIRNATVKLTYNGQHLLLDPYLGEAGSGPSYAGKRHSPVVELPVPVEKILEKVDGLLVSHGHSDHFDQKAQKILPKELPLICQPDDQAAFQAKGFHQLLPVTETLEWKGIRFTRIPGQHGSGEVLEAMGSASGFLLQAPGEPSLYWAGDTVLTDSLRAWVRQEQPDLILTHSCGAVWGEGTLILMDDLQTTELCRLAPKSRVIAIHMEAVDHATVTRQQLRETARRQGVREDQLLIPRDGELLTF